MFFSELRASSTEHAMFGAQNTPWDSNEMCYRRLIVSSMICGGFSFICCVLGLFGVLLAVVDMSRSKAQCFTTFWIVTAVMFCGGVVALMISGLVLDWGKQVGGDWLKDKIQALYPQYRNHAKIRPLLDSAWQHAGCGNYPINHLEIFAWPNSYCKGTTNIGKRSS